MISHYNDAWFKQNAKTIREWFDPESFDWKRGSKNLAKRCWRDFDVWWDPDKFNPDHIDRLGKHCSKHFDKWYDDEMYDKLSTVLIRRCSAHFDKWFDPETFNWIHFDVLIQTCGRHFKKWWPYRNRVSDDIHFHFHYMAIYCNKYFDDWWSYYFKLSNQLPLNGLSSKCTKHFDKWYSNKLLLGSDLIFKLNLINYNYEHFDEWFSIQFLEFDGITSFKGKCSDKFLEWVNTQPAECRLKLIHTYL